MRLARTSERTLELRGGLSDGGGSLRSLPLCCEALATQLGRYAADNPGARNIVVSSASGAVHH